MALQVWLPLNGDLHNQGLKQYNLSMFRGSEVYNNNGKIGKCFYANGVNTIKILNIIPDFYNYSAYSLCAWVYIEAQNTSHSGCGIVSAGNWNSQVLNLGLSDWSTNHYTRLRISGTNWSRTYAYNFSLNTWYHIVVSSDSNKTYAYVNGVLIGDSQTSFLPTSIEGDDICIGGATYYSGMQFFGRINDVRIYNHCLSKKEVEEISKGLVLHYQLKQPNQNLITEETYCITPWSDAIQAHEIYQGKFAYRVTNNILYSKTGNGANNIFPNITYSENTQYTMSVDWRDDYRTDNKNSSLYLRFHYTDGTYTQIISPVNSKKEWTHTVLISTAGKTVDKCTTTYGNGGQLYLTNLKLEKGIIETSFNHDNSNIIYDSSGYDNNGQLYEISANNNCSKFNISSKFNGSNSYIKVIDNKWMPQHTRELTINLWAKAASWPTSGRIFSCTETGGFNTEAGNSGYWRFPIYVCTNEAQTSYAYKYDSKEIQISALPINQWTMLTFVYDSTGTKTYINGELHHTYTNTSYGIHFNMNARLFLGCEANTASPSSPYFNGEESDFRIYVTALTSAQIKELYETSKIIDGITIKARDLEVSA